MFNWFAELTPVKVLVLFLLAGVAAPAVFAIGVRLGAEGDGVSAGQDRTERHPALILARRLIFALLIVAVVLAVLLITHDFIEHRIGFDWDDWDDWIDLLD